MYIVYITTMLLGKNHNIRKIRVISTRPQKFRLHVLDKITIILQILMR